MEHGLKTVEVYVKGPGSGREAAIRALQATAPGSNHDQGRYPDPAQSAASAEEKKSLKEESRRMAKNTPADP